MKITTQKILISLSATLFAFAIFSQEWNGSESNDWFNPLNWTPNEVPSTGDNVFIPLVLGDYPEIDGNVTIQDLDIAASATITLLPSNSLTITGALTGDGEIETIATACLILDDSGSDLVYTAEEIPNAPTGNANQEFCEGAIIDDLEITGNNITWYADATSTDPLDESEELVNNTSYFATQTVNDCESTDRLEVFVTVLENATGVETYTGCSGDGYEIIVNGTTYNESNPSGEEIFVNGAANDCDSIVTIALTFDIATGEETYAGCSGDGYEVVVNGTTYNEGNPSGVETIINGAASGCDSIVTIDLTFNVATGEETYSGCSGDGYEVIVNGITYNESNPSGEETITNGAVSGCDSIVTINLEFINIQTTDIVTACGSYEWIDGNTYTESNNTASVVLTSVATGCDSTVTLDLTIQSELTTSVTEVVNNNGMLVLIADQSAATYQWLDCNDGFSPVVNANNQTFVPQINGDYAVRITKGVCTDTSDCTIINELSTSAVDLDYNINVYPNPSNGMLTIETNGMEGSIEIHDALGRFIDKIAIKGALTSLDMSRENKGVYLLKVVQNNHSKVIRVVIR